MRPLTWNVGEYTIEWRYGWVGASCCVHSWCYTEFISLGSYIICS